MVETDMGLSWPSKWPVTRATFRQFRQDTMPSLPLPLRLDRDREPPLRTQLADQIREIVVSGAAMVGDRLPSSRALATDLGVSRALTEQAYDQLVAEGWLEGRHGSRDLRRRQWVTAVSTAPPAAPPAGRTPSGSTPARRGSTPATRRPGGGPGATSRRRPLRAVRRPARPARAASRAGRPPGPDPRPGRRPRGASW